MFFNSYIVAELLGRYLAIIERNEKKEFSEEEDMLKDLFSLPFSEAIDFFLSKKSELYDRLDRVTDNALNDYFWIKKSTDLEVTRKIQEKLLKTLKEGKDYSDFKRELDLERLGLGETGHYWKGAFDMNMVFAQSRGQYEEQLEGIQYGFKYGLFDAILDGRETEICHNLDGKVMLLTDWIEQGMYPPLHYRCRSRIVAITEEDVKDIGLTVEKKIEHVHVQKGFGHFNTREKDLKKLVKLKEKEVEDNKKKINFSALNIVNKNDINRIDENIKFGNWIENLDEKEKKGMKEILSSTEKNIKEFWSKYSDKFKIVNFASRKNYFDPRSGGIFINKSEIIKGKSFAKPFQVLFHELGHNIDYLMSVNNGLDDYMSSIYRSSKYNFTLSEMLKKEYDDYFESVRQRLQKKKGIINIFSSVTDEKVFKEIRKELQKISFIDRADLTDIIDGLSGQKLGMEQMRKEGYWNEVDISVEAFAEMFSTTISNKEGIENIKKYFPKSYEIFIEIINKYK